MVTSTNHSSTGTINFADLFAQFKFQKPTANQKDVISLIDELLGKINLDTTTTVGLQLLMELATGTGKTLLGIMFLILLKMMGAKNLFYVVPNKTMAQQVHSMFPEETVLALGRNEHTCLFYEGENFKADEVPCLSLKQCGHRVDQITGLTKDEGCAKCPYYEQKYIAKTSGKIVICTTAFYLFAIVFAKDFNNASGVVFDEVHNLAESVKNCLSYSISDYHLKRSVTILTKINLVKEAVIVGEFSELIYNFVKNQTKNDTQLLEDDQIESLISSLKRIDKVVLQRGLERAVSDGTVDFKEDRETIRKLEMFIRDVDRYIYTLGLALENGHKPLTYTFGYCNLEHEPNTRKLKKYELVIKSHYVAGLIVKRLISKNTLAYSATIGDPDVLKFVSGISFPFYKFTHSFDYENRRVYVPTDTANLSYNVRSKDQPKKTLKQIVAACKKFKEQNLRSLVILVSDKERTDFIGYAERQQLTVVSYGDKVTAKEAAETFKTGFGDILVGTSAHYSEGLDLPNALAPVIFFLRPGYGNPFSPQAQFDEKRFGKRRWALYNWKVMIEALQVSGRNIRGENDKGVTIFMSQQFCPIVFNSLPEYLKQSYRGNSTFLDIVDDTINFLKQ